MARHEWVKMEYDDGSAYVVGTVEMSTVGEWFLLHGASESVPHADTPAAVDVGTLRYMEAEGVLHYAVHLVGVEVLTFTSLARLLSGIEKHRRVGPISTTGEIRDRVYLPWHLWRDAPLRKGWTRPTTREIPYNMETLIREDGTIKRRRTG
jgi:hypothetical protein